MGILFYGQNISTYLCNIIIIIMGTYFEIIAYNLFKPAL